MCARSEPGINDSAADGSSAAEVTKEILPPDDIDFGSEVIRGFTLDNVLHSESEGDIHFGVYVPERYDGAEAYALYVTLPG